MTMHSLKPVTEASQRVLELLVGGLDVGDSRKVDRGLGFMAVHVEALQHAGTGVLYSVAHYYQSNGDLVPDPDVVFVRTANGWSPISFQNSIAYRVAVHFHDDGAVEVDQEEQADLVSFCNLWMKNIKEQQGLSPRK